MADALTRIDSLNEDMQANGDSILDLQAVVQSHDVKLEQIAAKLRAHDVRFDAHDARFDQIDAQLAEILSRLPQRPE